MNPAGRKGSGRGLCRGGRRWDTRPRICSDRLFPSQEGVLGKSVTLGGKTRGRRRQSPAGGGFRLGSGRADGDEAPGAGLATGVCGGGAWRHGDPCGCGRDRSGGSRWRAARVPRSLGSARRGAGGARGGAGGAGVGGAARHGPHPRLDRPALPGARSGGVDRRGRGAAAAALLQAHQGEARPGPRRSAVEFDRQAGVARYVADGVPR